MALNTWYEGLPAGSRAPKHSRLEGGGDSRDDLRLLCDCGHVPESLAESEAESSSGERWCEGGRMPLVRLLMGGRV